MNTDLTFITNEKSRNLLERFKVLIKDTKYFDVLVGYFYTSGFYALWKSLEKAEKIRILIGVKTGRQTYELIEKAKNQNAFNFSHAETKEEFSNTVISEMEKSEDQAQLEEGVQKFIEWLKSGKLEIKAYPTENIHAKLYIMTFVEGDRDVGRVITGSSNFSQAGLVDNLEFNIELKHRGDYDFAKEKFEELWDNAVDVSDEYTEAIQTRTWLNNTISPYELYLKYLYEYLKEKINIDQEEIFTRYVPHAFMDLEYQREAVKDAKGKLEEYGGVFLADVVGLGKTYISAMLAQQLDGRNLIICPPVLIEYWRDIFSDFRVPADVESLGKLDNLIEKGTEKYKNVFIDEAHRFRNETNQTYEKLKQICWGKRIILVSATPQNNTPIDLLSQIKLFQKGHSSTIPNLKDIERYFNFLQKKLKGIDRQSDFPKYISIIKENSKIIRENILKYLMVRRTRQEVRNYFTKDLENRKFKFPEVSKPNKIFYEFDEETDRVFNKTIEEIKKFKYARYTPILYLKHPDPEEEVGQRNLRRFMKILLVKRLESSFFAFKNTLDRFISSYERFIKMCEDGTVYISKKYTDKIFELLDNDDEEEIMKLVEEEKVRQHKISEFKDEYLDDLNSDLNILKGVKSLWKNIMTDPKIKKFKNILVSDIILKESKLIVFTESKETAEYLEKNLKNIYKDAIISHSSKSSAAIRDKIIENYDPNHKHPKNDIRILISTEVLSEGVNLHRSNVVINYDLPWNPARVIQRAGRVNRVDTKFDDIYIYNFFPTIQSNNVMKLEEAAIGKIQSFHNMLGEDAAYLTDGEEVSSYELFNRLNSKKVIEGEDEEEDTELKYLSEIRAIRDKNPDLFEKIKHLPKKARSAKKYSVEKETVLTFFRKGKLRKIFITDSDSTRELDFFQAAGILKSLPEEKREKLGEKFYEYLEKNKKEFELSTIEEIREFKQKGGKSSEVKLIRIIKAIQKMKGFTEDDEGYLKKVLNLLEEGTLPKQTTKTIVKNIGKETSHLKIYGVIRKHIPDSFFAMPVTEQSAQSSGPREVILSEYLVKEG
jgi:superfamily II DNA/RNA helicase